VAQVPAGSFLCKVVQPLLEFIPRFAGISALARKPCSRFGGFPRIWTASSKAQAPREEPVSRALVREGSYPGSSSTMISYVLGGRLWTSKRPSRSVNTLRDIPAESDLKFTSTWPAGRPSACKRTIPEILSSPSFSKLLTCASAFVSRLSAQGSGRLSGGVLPGESEFLYIVPSCRCLRASFRHLRSRLKDFRRRMQSPSVVSNGAKYEGMKLKC